MHCVCCLLAVGAKGLESVLADRVPRRTGSVSTAYRQGEADALIMSLRVAFPAMSAEAED